MKNALVGPAGAYSRRTACPGMTIRLKRAPKRWNGRWPARPRCDARRCIAIAQVQVPWRMISGSPELNANSRSVWMGFQIEAHSE